MSSSLWLVIAFILPKSEVFDFSSRSANNYLPKTVQWNQGSDVTYKSPTHLGKAALILYRCCCECFSVLRFCKMKIKNHLDVPRMKPSRQKDNSFSALTRFPTITHCSFPASTHTHRRVPHSSSTQYTHTQTFGWQSADGREHLSTRGVF